MNTLFEDTILTNYFYPWDHVSVPKLFQALLYFSSSSRPFCHRFTATCSEADVHFVKVSIAFPSQPFAAFSLPDDKGLLLWYI